MEVCSRQMTMTKWGQPGAAARGQEIEIISSNSPGTHTKQRGALLYSSLPAPGFSAKRTKDRDREYAVWDDIDVNTTEGNDDCDEERLEQQELINDMQVMECSMCGHEGLPQYLFKCLSCSYRYQHIYCSNLYPYEMKVAVCNWCLPVKLEIAGEEVDNGYHRNGVDSDIATKSDSKPQQVNQIKKHSKAFDYLLQIIADLADAKSHELTTTVNDYQMNPSCSNEDDAVHDQRNEVDCEFMSRKAKNLDVHHGLQQSLVIQEGQDKSDIAVRTEHEELKGALSDARAPLKRPRCDDSERPTKVTDCCMYDQQSRKSPDHRKTNKNKMDNDQGLWIQDTPSIDHDTEANAMANNAHKGLQSALKKQSSMEAAPKVANPQYSFPLHMQAEAVKIMDSTDKGDDDGEASALLSNKPISRPVVATAVSLSTSTWATANPTKPVSSIAGKRDLTTSPSRAFSRRYKLLADVLC